MTQHRHCIHRRGGVGFFTLRFHGLFNDVAARRLGHHGWRLDGVEPSSIQY